MTTAKKARELIGRRGLWAADLSLTFLVEVVDVRECWGREQYEIKPTQGSGRRWVSAQAVRLLDSQIDKVA